MTLTEGTRILGGTATQLVAKAVTVVVGLASVRILTSYLGVGGYGVYVTATAFVALVASVADGGFPLLIAKETAEHGRGSNRYVAVAIRGRLVTSAVVSGLAFLVAALVFQQQPAVLTAVALLLPSVPSLAVASTCSALLQARMLFAQLAVVEVVVRLALFVGLVVIAQTSGGLVGCLLVVVGAGWILHMGLLLAVLPPELRPSLGGVPWRTREFVDMARRSLPLGAATLINGVYFRVDAVMVSVLAGVHMAGQYGVAYRGLDMLLMVPSALAAATLPSLSRSAPSRPALEALVGRSMTFVVVVMTPLAVMVWLAAPRIVAVIGGTKFAASADILRILAVASWFSSVDIVLGITIVASGMQGRLLWINVGALVMNVIGNLFMIPRMGGEGAALMTVVSEAAVLVAAAIAITRVLRIRPYPPRSGRLAVATLALLASAAVLSRLASPLTAGLFATAAYLVTLLGSGAVSVGDAIGWVRHGARRRGSADVDEPCGDVAAQEYSS